MMHLNYENWPNTTKLSKLLNSVRDAFRQGGSIFLLPTFRVGVVAFSLMLLMRPVNALACVVGLIACVAMSKLFKMQDVFKHHPEHVFNPILVALTVPSIWELDLNLCVCIAALSSITFLFSVWFKTFFYSSGIPPMSFPFSIIGTAVYFLATTVGSLTSNTENMWIQDAWFFGADFFPQLVAPILGALPASLKLFFTTISINIFLPNPVAGLIIAITVAFISPTIVVLWLVGFYAGIGVEMLWTGNYQTALSFSYHRNYLLAFSTIAGIFMTPSWRSIGIGLIAVFWTAVLAKFCLYFWGARIPVLTLPFCLCMFTFLPLLRLCGLLAKYYPEATTPEQRASKNSLYWGRFRSGEASVALPVIGSWKITQGFSGSITHKGLHRFALDFEQMDAESHDQKGHDLGSYRSYGAKVVSPVNGYITEVVNHVVDNKIGFVDHANPLGNCIRIYADAGFYVVLAHLKHGSAVCTKGQRVTIGTEIAQVGNSGYSSVPHLHLHAQVTPYGNGPTIPFHLANYFSEGVLQFHSVPAEGSVVSSVANNVALTRSFAFRFDETLNISQRQPSGLSTDSIEVQNCLDHLTGEHYFEHKNTRLYHWMNGASFYFYRYDGPYNGALFDLYLALPRVPLIFGRDVDFHDMHDIGIQHGWATKLTRYVRYFFSGSDISSSSKYHVDVKNNVLSGRVFLHDRVVETRVQLDPVDAVVGFDVGDRKYEVSRNRVPLRAVS